MELTTDATVFWEWGPIVINATLVYSWIVMAILTVGSWLITRNLRVGAEIPRWQNFLEALVEIINNQIKDISQRDPKPFLPFIGTLFLFISVSNLLSIFPVLESPTSSLSTTAALALCVFFAVPIFGITQTGIKRYLKHYVEPSPVMAPFHIISELTRTFSLAIRLFGNVMSGGLIISILLSIIPLFVPVLLHALELLIGQIQAYIFAILAMVYISSGVRSQAG